MTNHSDFVKTGLWAGSATELAIRLWERDESKIHLPWTTPLTTTLVWQTTHGTARPPTPPRAYPPPDRDAGRGHGGRDNDRRHDRRPWTRRADGTPLTTPLVWQTTHGTASRGRGVRDNDRRYHRQRYAFSNGCHHAFVVQLECMRKFVALSNLRFQK